MIILKKKGRACVWITNNNNKEGYLEVFTVFIVGKTALIKPSSRPFLCIDFDKENPVGK